MLKYDLSIINIKKICKMYTNINPLHFSNCTTKNHLLLTVHSNPPSRAYTRH